MLRMLRVIHGCLLAIGCAALSACGSLGSAATVRRPGGLPLGHPAARAARIATDGQAPRPGAARSSASGSFQRQHPTTPFFVQRVRYDALAGIQKLLELQDDPVLRVRSMRRVGDGVLSLGIQDGRGRWLQTFECGGHLFVVGQPQQTCRIVIRNESRCRLEITAGMDGRDLVAGGVYEFANPGIVVAPLQTFVFGDAKKDRRPLRFAAVPAVTLPVLQARTPAELGVIHLAIFHEKDRFPWEGSTRTLRRNTPGKFPQPTHAREPLPHDYR